MLYDDYARRMVKVASFRAVIKRHRILILCVLAAALITAGCLVGLRGVVYDSGEIADIEYGESLDYSASAFLSDVEYEFRAEGESEWTSTVPHRAGTYYVRAVSQTTFGVNYGEVKSFTIKPKPLKIAIADRVTFGEKPDYAAELAEGDNIEQINFVYDDLSVRSTAVAVDLSTLSIVNSDGEDVTYCYDVDTQKEDINFDPRKITLTVAPATAVYNGTPLSSDAWELTGGGTLGEGDSIVAVFDKSITDVGELENVPQINVAHHVMGADGTDVTANYEITTVVGKLTVQKRTVIIDTSSSAHVYDGKAYTDEGFSFGEGSLAPGDRITIKALSSQTDVGTRDNEMVFEVVAPDGRIVTDNYAITCNPGILEVTKREITVSSGSASKVYDGTPLSAGLTGWGTLVPGHTLTLAGQTTLTDPGTTANDFTVNIFAGIRDVTANYDIIKDTGTLEVAKRKITLTTNSATKVYDGAELTTEATLSGDTPDKIGQSFSVVRKTSLVHVGRVENACTLSITTGGDRPRDVTAFYEIENDFGHFEITPAPLKIGTVFHTWIYDGNEHRELEFNVLAGSFVSGDTPVVSDWTVVRDVMYEEGTNTVTSTDNVLTVTLKEGSFSLITDYDVTYEYGYLMIKPMQVTFTTATDEWVYDGEAHYHPTVMPDKALPKDHVVDVTDYTKVRNALKVSHDVGEDFTTANAVDFDIRKDGEVKNRNFAITVVKGSLTLRRRPVTVTAGSLQKEYDGTALRDDGEGSASNCLTNSGKDVGLVSGHTVTKASTGSRTDVGVGKNVITPGSIVIRSGAQEVTYNYIVTLADGDLKVTPRTMTVTSASNTWTYDDEIHSERGFTADEKLLPGTVLTVTADTPVRYVLRNGDGSVGSYDNVLDFDISGATVDADAVFADNYDITAVPGKLKIEPVALTVTTRSENWTYDGIEHTYPYYDITAGALASRAGYPQSHAVDVSALSGITFFGEIDNEFEIKIAYENFPSEDLTSNYDISYVYGTLGITKRPVTLRSLDNIWVYDGYDHWEGGVQPQNGTSLAAGDAVEVTKFTYVNEYRELETDNELTFKIMHGGIDASESYDVTFIAGKLFIDKRPIKVKSGTTSWVYDGYEHDLRMLFAEVRFEHDEFGAPVYLSYELAEGHEFMTEHGDELHAASVKNVTREPVENVVEFYIVVKTGDDGHGGISYRNLTDNYDIETEWGTLSVTPRPIKVTTASAEKVYDGDPLTSDRLVCVDVDNSVFYDFAYGQTGKGVCSGSQTDVGESPCVLDRSTFAVMAGDEDVTDNYDVSFADKNGILKVTKRPVTVLTDSENFVYNGKYRFNEGFRIVRGSFVKDHALVVTDHTEILNVAEGSVDNELQFDITGTDAKMSNYDITVFNGQLRVTPMPVTVRSATDEFLYDGDYHYNDGWSFSDGEFVVNEGTGRTPTLEVIGFNTVRDVVRGENGEVLSVANILTYEFAGDPIDAQNYSISYEVGTLKVIPLTVTVTTPSLTKEYDGEPLGTGEATIEGVLDEHVALIYPEYSSITDVLDSGADHTVTMERIIDRNGDDVSHNYEIEYHYGILIVVPRIIGITTSSYTWKYDGETHYDNRYQITSGSLVAGHDLVQLDWVYIKDVGKIDNEMTFKIVEGDVDKTPNYDIRFDEIGVLEIENDPGAFVLLEIQAATTGSLYLREKSYDLYNGQCGNWGDSADAVYSGAPIQSGGKRYSASNFPSVVLKNTGMEKQTATVRVLYGGFAGTLIPYYLDYETFDAFTNDIRCDVGVKTGAPYDVSYFYYMYDSDKGATVRSGDLGLYANECANYRNFVEKNYLAVPTATAEFLDKYIRDMGFDRNAADIIDRVSEHVQKVAWYDLNFDWRLEPAQVEDGFDMVQVFFDRENPITGAVCRHYATAATMLYRRLGIPARYTTGVLCPTKAGEIVEVMSTQAHAWVEVFLDGVGWVAVDVTGRSLDSGNGGQGGNGPGGSGEGDGEGEGDGKQFLYIKPVKVCEQYTGAPILAKNEVVGVPDQMSTITIEELGERGYTWTAVVSGSCIDVGSSPSEVTEFTLFDPSGKDVTSSFRIKFKPGEIIVTKKTISFYADYNQKEYDGKPLSFVSDDYDEWYEPENKKRDYPEGVSRIELVFKDDCRFPVKPDESLSCDEKIGNDLTLWFMDNGVARYYDAFGNDVSDLYADNFTILFIEGELIITKYYIVLAANGLTQVATGQEITNPTFSVVQKPLPEELGFRIECTVSGGGKDPGKYTNTIRAVAIYNADGEDVTNCFTVSILEGTIEILKDE